MKKILSLPFLLLLLLAAACDIINPDEDIPVTLLIEDVSVQTTAGQGSNSHKITNVWIFIDDNLLGAFPLPAKVPILENGSHKLGIRAGVNINAIASAPDFYPFYAEDVHTIDFVPGEEVTIAPVFKYVDDAVFQLVEDFEGVNHAFSFDRDNNDDTFFDIVDDGAFEGSSGRARLTNQDSLVWAASNLINTIPVGGRMFIEIDYKNDVALAMGLLGYGSTGQLLYTDFDQNPNTFTADSWGVQAKDVWNKAYFDIEVNVEMMRALPDVVEYELSLLSIFNSGAQDTLSQADVYVDNIKLLHF